MELPRADILLDSVRFPGYVFRLRDGVLRPKMIGEEFKKADDSEFGRPGVLRSEGSCPRPLVVQFICISFCMYRS